MAREAVEARREIELALDVAAWPFLLLIEEGS
jgi:hypothetical protein